ncbi:MAG: biotin--[acetyl-CoA-carboxylase] ligase [Actinomycetota bacterium]|nr:biotin--[acetyl-CoA-carboxylase] ligase [Actinomycetota bacterium]
MIGTPRVHHRLTDSTNQRAKELAGAGAPHGTIVSADEQAAGRGRQGRAWMAPPRSAVLMSLVVRDLDESAALLPLATAVAVCEAAETVARVSCAIKWPNDVWIDGRKVCGILVEGRPAAGWAVIGIGLNVTTTEFPEELRDIATSLRLAGGSASVEEALTALVAALDHRLGAPPAEILTAWRSRDALAGRRIAWADGEGVAAGIDDAGSLLVDTDASRVALGAGEVHLERLD